MPWPISAVSRRILTSIAILTAWLGAREVAGVLQQQPPNTHYFKEIGRSLMPRQERYNASRAWPTIKIFYTHSNDVDQPCMDAQMAEAKKSSAANGMSVDVESFPMPEFKNCDSVDACIKEHPECFPTKNVSYWFTADGSTDAKNKVATNWCAYMSFLEKAEAQSAEYDYFLFFRGTVALDSNFAKNISNYLNSYPAFWTMTLIDGPSELRSTEQDQVSPEYRSGLPLSPASATKDTYLQSLAYLLRSQQVSKLRGILAAVPAIPVDLIAKVPRPLHVSMWSYRPGLISSLQDLSAKERNGLAPVCSKSYMRANRRHQAKAIATHRRHHSIDDDVNVEIDDKSIADEAASLKASLESSTARENNGTREMILFGMYDSGTKMMQELIMKNLEKPNKVSLCKDYAAWGYCGRIWKHTHPRSMSHFWKLRSGCGPKCNKLGRLSDAVAVVMVRHPFSLIRSLQKHHYDLDCGDGVGSDKEIPLYKGCNYPEPTEEWMKKEQAGMPRVAAAPCENAHGRCWDNLVSAWNSYIEGYMKLTDVFHDVVFLRYEDVVEQPLIAVWKVADAVGLPRPATAKVVGRAMGIGHGKGFNGLDGAAKKMATLDYDTNYECTELDNLCRRLDRGLLFELGYQGCQQYWPAYGQLMHHEHGDRDTKKILNEQDQEFCDVSQKN